MFISNKLNITALVHLFVCGTRTEKEVEFGLVEPSWILTPLDAGAYQVLSDGYKLVIDKKRHFENLKL